LYGGSGNDTMQLGNRGNNTLVWLDGDAGTVAAPAEDTIYDFNLDRSVLWHGQPSRDILDLSDLLIDEDAPGADLTHYLNIALSGTDTVINVSSTGNLNADGSNFDQQIRLRDIDITNGVTDQHQIINDLITAGTLVVDQ